MKSKSRIRAPRSVSVRVIQNSKRENKVVALKDESHVYSPIVPGLSGSVVESVGRAGVCRPSNTVVVLTTDSSWEKLGVGVGDAAETIYAQNQFHVSPNSSARFLVAVPGQIPQLPLSLSRYRSITNRRYPIAIRFSIHAVLSPVYRLSEKQAGVSTIPGYWL